MKITGNNINIVFTQFIKNMKTIELEEHNTRGGNTLVVPTGIVSVYENPRRRVLFNTTRKVNPRYQLLEALWVLAGRDDVAFLAEQLPLMKSFSDDAVRFHGAYGQRLRHSFGFDQIEKAVEILKANPSSRQVVLNIYNPMIDLGAVSKDIPCNNYINLYIHEGKLELHITAISNDMMTGAYGVNVVQFSVLQEYIANKVGVEVGKMVQHSNNAHVYVDGSKFTADVWHRCSNGVGGSDLYQAGVKETPFIVGDETPEMFDSDLKKFFDTWDEHKTINTTFDTLFFNFVVLPMYNRNWDAMMDCDWKVACKLLMRK